KEKLIETCNNETKSIHHLVFQDTIKAIQEKRKPLCFIDNAIQHTMCIENGFLSSNGVKSVAQEFCESKKDPKESELTNAYFVGIKGINDTVKESAKTGKSFYELGLAWGAPAKTIEI
ncbi:MAG TPA: hypothetical protein PK821_05115, partial [Victivallales bacterium]|nr:hypothetical protein [Victivallales bacterium]